MSFDRLAPFYGAMETFLAGGKLQRCRTQFLGRIPEPRRILLVGEGHGRTLAECLKRFPTAAITAVDSSASMLDAARTRTRRAGLESTRVEFIHADALEWSPPPAAYDLIITHFFFDCFRPDQIARLAARLARASRPGADWLLADFQLAPSGLARLRSRVMVAAMYAFFRAAVRLPASSLAPTEPALTAAGFRLRDRVQTEWGLLKSEWWRRTATDCAAPP